MVPRVGAYIFLGNNIYIIVNFGENYGIVLGTYIKKIRQNCEI